MMMIEHIEGSDLVVSDGTVDRVLLLRVRHGQHDVNHFTVHREEEEYPSLHVHVKDEFACLHYLPERDCDGFRSDGNPCGLDEDGVTVFWDPSDGIEALNESIQPWSVAVAAVKEFLATLQLPSCVQWFEL